MNPFIIAAQSGKKRKYVDMSNDADEKKMEPAKKKLKTMHSKQSIGKNIYDRFNSVKSKSQMNEWVGLFVIEGDHIKCLCGACLWTGTGSRLDSLWKHANKQRDKHVRLLKK